MAAKFPVDAPKTRVVRTLERLGSRTPLTMPNHPHLKGSTLRTICTQARISRQDFMAAYDQA